MKRKSLSILVLLFCAAMLLFPAQRISADQPDIVSYPLIGGKLYFDKASGIIVDCDQSVTRAVIPEQIEGVPVTAIGDKAFFLCTYLEKVTIPSGILHIGKQAFESCFNMTSVNLGEGLQSIGEDAFSMCDDIKEISLPGSLKTIGARAFYGCRSLKSIHIPAGVESIGSNAFSPCESLTAISVDPSNLYFSSDDANVLFNKEKTELLQCPGAYSGAYSIPDGVTTIAHSAFHCCDKLTEVEIPDSVTVIEADGFYMCSSLKEVTIPDSVTQIGSRAFYGCSDLTSAILPKHITSIAPYSFAQTGLTGIVIPEGVETIGDSAFYMSSDLAKVTLPDSVTLIDHGAFFYCFALTEIALGENLEKIGEWAFSGTGLVNVHLPAALTSIEDFAFSGCYALEAFTVAEGNPQFSVDEKGVLYNRNKTKVVICPGKYAGSCDIHDGVSEIGIGAFYACRKMTAVTIPDSVDTIGDSAFYQCEALAEVTMGSGIKRIGDSAFGLCYALSHVFFNGSEGTWSEIEFGESNECLFDAMIHFAPEEPTEPTEEPTEPTEEPTEPTEEPTEPTEELTEPTEEPTEPTEEPTEPDTPDLPFTDVMEADYFYTPVLWAVEQGITTGTSSTEFSPEAPCTRGQIVTFLWRAFGSPEPKSSSNPFTDVPENMYYYKAVLWAVEKGITTGTSSATFSPEETCTRGQVATFLWRACGKPAPQSSSNPFSDVSSSVYYYQPILWAVEQGITNGTGGGKFSPEDSCTRGQIVTFLYRALAK